MHLCSNGRREYVQYTPGASHAYEMKIFTHHGLTGGAVVAAAPLLHRANPPKSKAFSER